MSLRLRTGLIVASLVVLATSWGCTSRSPARAAGFARRGAGATSRRLARAAAGRFIGCGRGGGATTRRLVQAGPAQVVGRQRDHRAINSRLDRGSPAKFLLRGRLQRCSGYRRGESLLGGELEVRHAGGQAGVRLERSPPIRRADPRPEVELHGRRAVDHAERPAEGRHGPGRGGPEGCHRRRLAMGLPAQLAGAGRAGGRPRTAAGQSGLDLAGDGQVVTLRFEEPTAKVYFEMGHKDEVRTFWYADRIESGERRSARRWSSPRAPDGSPRPRTRLTSPVEPDRWFRAALRRAPRRWISASSIATSVPPAGGVSSAADGDRLVFEDGTPARFWGSNLAAYVLYERTRKDPTRRAFRDLVARQGIGCRSSATT